MPLAVSLIVALALLLLAGVLWLVFYPPLPRDLGGIANLDSRARRIRIPVADGDSLDAWHLPGRLPALVMLFHGYGRDHARMWRYGHFLSNAGYSLLTFDFRTSRARRRLAATLGHAELADARAVLEWTRSQPELSQLQIGVLGESLGGSIAMLLVAEAQELRALVVDSGFATSDAAIRDAITRWARLPAWPALGAIRALGRRLTGHDLGATDVRPAATSLADRAVFFIHCMKDRRIAPEQTRTLWRAAGARHEMWEVPGAGHNEGWLRHRAEYEKRVLEFFDLHLRVRVGE